MKPPHVRIVTTFLFLLFLTGCGGGGGGGGGGGENTPPEAYSISQKITSSYNYAKASASDADHDTFFFVLDSPSYESDVYDVAYLDQSTGEISLTLNKNYDGRTIRLSYRASDGIDYSNSAEAIFTWSEAEATTSTGLKLISVHDYYALEKAVFPDDDLTDDGGLPLAVDLSGNFPVVGNQGRQGSCVGWATAYALKTFQEKTEMDWHLGPFSTFSPAWIYNQINGGNDEGSSPIDALDLIVRKGAATLATMPYDESDHLSPPNAAASLEAGRYKAHKYSRLGSIRQVRASIANRLPVVLSMQVFESFNYLRGENSVYNSYVTPTGYHAVTAVGYDNNRHGGAFKIINSWGRDWGDDGYFWLPYKDFSTVIRGALVLFDSPNSEVTLNAAFESAATSDQSLPNLQVASWQLLSNPQPGQESEVEWNIVNSGTESAVGGFWVTLMMSEDEVFGSGDPILQQVRIDQSLQPGESLSVTSDNRIIFKIPESTESGNYNLAVKVDDTGETKESNERDNINIGDKIQIEEPNLPDFHINSWSINEGCDPESTAGCQVTFEIANLGTVDEITPWMEVRVISNETGQIYSAIPFPTYHPSTESQTLPAGGTFSNTVGVAFGGLDPSQRPPGQYFFELSIDPNNRTKESDESNNESRGSLFTIENNITDNTLPDLVIKTWGMEPAYCNLMVDCELSYEVSNSGQDMPELALAPMMRLAIIGSSGSFYMDFPSYGESSVELSKGESYTGTSPTILNRFRSASTGEPVFEESLPSGTYSYSLQINPEGELGNFGEGSYVNNQVYGRNSVVIGTGTGTPQTSPAGRPTGDSIQCAPLKDSKCNLPNGNGKFVGTIGSDDALLDGISSRTVQRKVYKKHYFSRNNVILPVEKESLLTH